MHASPDNCALLNRLFAALAEKNAGAMESCYHPDAHFRDIAFDLRGREKIGDMWRMICAGDIEAKFEIVEVDDRAGRVALIDRYTFHSGKSANPVVNLIDSRFEFDSGLIRSQHDHCDPREWARQALGGGILGFLAGRLRLVRSLAARRKLRTFLASPRVAERD